jgi:hypothetical protein
VDKGGQAAAQHIVVGDVVSTVEGVSCHGPLGMTTEELLTALKDAKIAGRNVEMGFNDSRIYQRSTANLWLGSNSCVVRLQGAVPSVLQGAASPAAESPRSGSWAGFPDKTPFKNTDSRRRRKTSRSTGTRYFCKPETRSKVIAVGIPCYNEQRHELMRTLQSLQECYDHKLDPRGKKGRDYAGDASGYYTAAVIILDGLDAVSDSMREFVEEVSRLQVQILSLDPYISSYNI